MPAALIQLPYAQGFGSCLPFFYLTGYFKKSELIRSPLSEEGEDTRLWPCDSRFSNPVATAATRWLGFFHSRVSWGAR